MVLLRPFTNQKPALTRDKDKVSFWETPLIPKGLLILLGLGMGILLALLIVNGQWALVVALLLLVPAAVLFNTYPFAALLIWMLANAFLQTTPDTASRQMFWIIHRAMPPIVLGLVALANLLGVAKNRSRAKLGRAELAMVFFLGLALSNIFTFHSSGPIPYLYMLYDQVFAPLCLYGLVRLTMPDEQDMKRLIPIAFALTLVEAVVGIISWRAPQLLPPDWRVANERAIGTLSYTHAYTTTLVFFSLLLFQAAMNRKPGVIRTIFWVVIALGSVGVFFSFSRGSWLGGIAATVGLLILYPKTTLRLAIILLLLMSILGSTVLSQQIAFAQERMNSEDTANGRWVIWDAGLQMIRDKPFFGWGYGDYNLYAGQFQRRVRNFVAVNAQASHNNYIAIAAELGLPAFFLFVFPVLWWLMLTLKVLPRMPKEGFWSRSLLIVFWLVILDHITVNFFSDMHYSSYGMGMWWITLGLIANMIGTYLQADDSRPPQWVWHAAQATKESGIALSSKIDLPSSHHLLFTSNTPPRGTEGGWNRAG